MTSFYKSDFSCSVIIPVYKAEQYLRNAVESSCRLPEVVEVLLIEDGSPDQSYAVCLELAKEYGKVRVLTHPDRQNKGAGYTRNLGIDSARAEFISFLDSDDYYLTNRFDEARRIFESDPRVDGVYDAYGSQVLNEVGQKEVSGWFNRSSEIGQIHYHSNRNTFPSRQLFLNMVRKRAYFFHTNSITLRKSFLDKYNLRFDPELRLHQDSMLWHQIAFYGNIVPGNSEITSVRTYHGENRETKKNYASISFYYQKLFYWSMREKVELLPRLFLLKTFILHHPKRRNYNSMNPIKKYLELFSLLLNGIVQLIFSPNEFRK